MEMTFYFSDRPTGIRSHALAQFELISNLFQILQMICFKNYRTYTLV